MSRYHRIQDGLCASCSKRCAPPEEAAYVPDNVTMFTVTFYNDNEIIKLGVCGECKPLLKDSS